MKARSLWALVVLVSAAHLVLLDAVPARLVMPAHPNKANWTARAVLLPGAPAPSVPAEPARAQPFTTPSAPPAAQAVAARPVPKPADTPSTLAAAGALADARGNADPGPPALATVDPARWVIPVDAAVAAAHAAAVERTPAQTLAATVPGSVSLRYDVTAFTRQRQWAGQGRLQWRHDGDRYEARMDIGALWLPTRTQTSTGRVTAEGLVPLRFSDKARHEEATHFLREQGRISFSSNKPDAPLAPGAQDRLSVLLQLGALIAGGPARFPPGTTIAIQTAGTREAETWLFSVDGPETLELPGGRVPALKLTRTPRKEFDVKVELWLAPGMDYVPVRLRLTQPSGDWADQQWASTDKG